MLECYDPSSIQLLLALTPILAGALGTLWASQHFAKTISQHAAVVASCRLSGRAAARRLLDACGLHQVTVERSANRDCYDRASRQVRLSPDNYQSAAISALAVAAHEVGHAQQFATHSLVARAIPVVHKVCYGLMGVGFVVTVLGFTTIPLSLAGLLLLAVGVVSLTLQTAVVVPREIDATRRAMKLAHDSELLATAPKPSNAGKY